MVYGADKAILNGFRVASGHAVGDDLEWGFGGGGMVNDGVSPVIEDCEFAFNVAAREGGAMFNVGNGSGNGPKIVRTRFVNNTAGRRGGAIMNDGAWIEIIESILELSSAGDGGALFNLGGSPRICRTVFRHNAATGTGGAIGNQGRASTDRSDHIRAQLRGRSGGAMYTVTAQGRAGERLHLREQPRATTTAACATR